MNAEHTIENFPVKQPFHKEELMTAIHVVNPNYSDNSLKWLLSKLKSENKIEKVGRGIYCRTAPSAIRKDYDYIHSDTFMELVLRLEKQYPILEFQMWETVQMNEFINHQLAHNTIIVDVEKELVNAVFETLKESLGGVLISPGREEYYAYRRENDTVIVQSLVSVAPSPIKDTHSCCLEKIIVDMFSSKITGQLISKGEYPGLLEEAFSKYVIDETKLFRYASRRRNKEKIIDFIRSKTTVKLHTVGD
jgi:hypothetical protein